MPFKKKTIIGELKLGENAAIAVNQRWRASCDRRNRLSGRSGKGGRAW